MIKQGNLRGEKVQYPDGVGYCIWYPFSIVTGNDEDENTGTCFDFIDTDIKKILQDLKSMEEGGGVYISDGDFVFFVKKDDIKDCETLILTLKEIEAEPFEDADGL